MRTMTKMIVVESKLVSRDWALLAFGLVFPALLLYLVGAFAPGFQDPEPHLGGLRPVDGFTTVVLVLIFAMIGVTSIPAFLSSYRHQEVLRRLRTTPVGPSRLLGAQLVAHLALGSLATAGAVLVALFVLDVPMDGSWGWSVLALLLSATSLFAFGLVVGAVAPTPSSAPVIGTFSWMGLMFFAGLWYPREEMADGLRRVSDLSPGGAAVDAIQAGWFGGGPAASSLAVLAAYTVLVSAVAALTFRWE